MNARGGKAVQGAPIGILMLQARFARIPGDVGNARTWPFPVLYKVIEGASPQRVVHERADGLLDRFIDGARELVATGAEAIVTNCGFLALHQPALARALAVPVATSALMLIPFVQSLLPEGRQVGVITIDRASLGADHLRAVGVDAQVPIVGLEGSTLHQAIFDDALELDAEAVRADVLTAGRRLRAQHPQVGAIVLECTNLPPYAAALQADAGMPVWDMVSLVHWVHAGLRPHRFEST